MNIAKIDLQLKLNNLAVMIEKMRSDILAMCVDCKMKYKLSCNKAEPQCSKCPLFEYGKEIKNETIT